jgi:hypothetical protein
MPIDKRSLTVAVLAAAIGLPVAAIAGPDWVETGDAGSDLQTAQVPGGLLGSLNTISGVLMGGTLLVGDYEDCYIIRIANPATFSCTITNANFNAQLFLFNISLPGGAFGLLANDDQAVGNNKPRFQNFSTDGTNVMVDLPGDYMIGVTGFNNDPLSLTGPIFNQSSLIEVSGPDGVGGFNRHVAWTGGGEFGNYIMTLTGAEFPTFPSPGTLPLLAFGGLAMTRRKR